MYACKYEFLSHVEQDNNNNNTVYLYSAFSKTILSESALHVV